MFKLGKNVIKYYNSELKILFLCNMKSKKDIMIKGEAARILNNIINGDDSVGIDCSELVKDGFLYEKAK